MMAISLILVLVVAAAIVVGLVTLLSFPRTRLVGAILLVFVGFLLGGSLLVGMFFTVRPLPVGSPAAEPAGDRVIVELSAGAEDDSAGEPKKAKSVLRVLANALLKAIDEEERGEESPTASALPPLAMTASSPPPESSRPAWVEREPRLVNGAYEMALTVGPYLTLEECQAQLPAELHKAVAAYVERQIGPEAARQVRLPLGFIEEDLVQAQWEEHKEYSVGPMVRLHVLLGFDRRAAERIREEWDRLVVQQRIWGVGVLGATLLVVLAAVYGYLKVDLATEGRYRKRLRAATAVVIVLAAAAGAMLS